MPRLQLFGRATLLDDDGRVLPLSSRRHPVAVLALLMASPDHLVSRTRAVSLLWPGVSDRVGRNRLTTSLHSIRRALGEGAVKTVGSDLLLDVETLGSDLLELRNALQGEAWADAVALYGGPFLDGFWLSGSPEFDEWTERERARLEWDYQGALEQLAGAAERSGDNRESVRLWTERATRSPFDSRVALSLIRSLARAGSRAEAARVARNHTRVLETELGSDPGADFQAEVERILGEGAQAVEDPRPHRPPRRSLAILPFEIPAPTPDAEFLAEGLHLDLLTELSKLGDLTVISRATAAQYRGSAAPERGIAEELHVAHVVTGSLQVTESRMRLRVQLVDAERDSYVWAERYDRALTASDLFDLQSELVAKIASAIRAELTPDHTWSSPNGHRLSIWRRIACTSKDGRRSCSGPPPAC